MSESTPSRRNVLGAVGLAGIGGLAGCLGGGSESDSELRAAFVYQTELADVGWARAHDDGRQAVDDEYDWLETDYSDAISGGDARAVFEQYANDGYDVIFGCTTEYMDPMSTVAEQYPDVTFEHCNGTTNTENMGRYMGRSYEGWYLCGVAAGHLTESNTLGMVVSIPIPELVRQINAFTLGARAANSDATTAVRWLNGWYDPPGSTQATNALIDEGADVIASTMASPAAVRTASDNEVWSMAANTSMAEQGGDYYATAQIYNWEAFYGDAVREVRDDSWSSDFFWGGLASGVVSVDEFGPQVPDEVSSDVEAKRSEIESGERDMWEGTAFEGEDDEFLFSEVDSYVEGVEGEVPSGE